MRPRSAARPRSSRLRGRRRRSGIGPSTRPSPSGQAPSGASPSRSASDASSAASSARAYGSNAVRSARARWPALSAPRTVISAPLSPFTTRSVSSSSESAIASRSRTRLESTWTASRISCSWVTRAELSDQLQVGLDHRRPARRYRRVTLGPEPSGELVALRGRCALDPLNTPDRGAAGARQDHSPPREPALLSLGVEQREREYAARDHGRQPAPGRFRQDADRALLVRGLHDLDAAELRRDERFGPSQPADSWAPGIGSAHAPAIGGRRRRRRAVPTPESCARRPGPSSPRPLPRMRATRSTPRSPTASCRARRSPAGRRTPARPPDRPGSAQGARAARAVRTCT